MKLFRTVRQLGSGLTRIFAVLSLSCCLNGSLHLCFCETDPDACGHDCHTCTPENEDTCDHLTLQVDDPLVPPCHISVPQTTYSVPVFKEASLIRPLLVHVTRPAATGPPHTRLAYPLACAVRLYPRT